MSAGPRVAPAARRALAPLGLVAVLAAFGGVEAPPVRAAPPRDPAAQAASSTATPRIQLTAAAPAVTEDAAGRSSPAPSATVGGPQRGTAPARGTRVAPATAAIAPPALPDEASAAAAATAATTPPVVRRVGPLGVRQVVDDPAAAALWRAATASAGAPPVRPPPAAADGRGPWRRALAALLALALAALAVAVARDLGRGTPPDAGLRP